MALGLRMWVSALSAVALLAVPSFAAAADAGHKRVAVRYSQQGVVKIPARTLARVNYGIPEVDADGAPVLHSSSVMVADFNDGQTIYAKNNQNVAPIASITKLMTAMVVLDARLALDETVQIEIADFDFVKFTHSRLGIGTGLSRREMLRLALMSSENRAAAALGRAYPGGMETFIAAMNRKAAALGMSSTRFVDSTGLSRRNVSTAQDLVKMVKAAYHYPLIREFTTTSAHQVENLAGQHLQFGNSNGLVRNPQWKIGLSKTGYIGEAGRCLVMQASIASRPVVIVLLDSSDKSERMADANRIKRWLEINSARNGLVS